MTQLRSDAIFTRKRVHIKIDKDAYIRLRTLLFRYDISVQEIFEDFALLLASESDQGTAALKRYARKKIKKKISALDSPERKDFSEHDADILYDLIAEDEEQHEREDEDDR